MQNIAFLKLMRSTVQNMRPDPPRIIVEKSHHILQLVAISNRSARLVKAGPRQDPRRHGLVKQPAIDHDIKCRIGRMDLDRAEQIIPKSGQSLECGVDGIRRLPFGDQPFGMGFILSLPEQKTDFRASSRFQIQMNLIGSAGIAAGFRQPFQPPAMKACRAFKIAFPAQKFLTAGGKGVQRLIGGQERRPSGKIRIPEIARQNCLQLPLVGT